MQPVSPARQAEVAPGLRTAARSPRQLASLPPLKATRLLDQVRERIRYLHYSLRTEHAYVHWIRAFVRFHGLRHPAELGAPEVEAYLTFLATQRSVAPATHNQALAALLFLYTKVLGVSLPWLREIGRPKASRHLPVVLTPAEVVSVLERLQGEHRLLGCLLYGTGLRITEALQLRVKDVDFSHQALIVRQGKGRKAGAARPCGRGHDHDLHPRAQAGWRRGALAAGQPGAPCTRGRAGGQWRPPAPKQPLTSP